MSKIISKAKPKVKNTQDKSNSSQRITIHKLNNYTTPVPLKARDDYRCSRIVRSYVLTSKTCLGTLGIYLKSYAMEKSYVVYFNTDNNFTVFNILKS